MSQQPIQQHNRDFSNNLLAWQNKPLLQKVYAGFYRRIAGLIEPQIPGWIVEIGSGIGSLKSFLPAALYTDIFEHAGLDVVCDGYELPFVSGSLSHLVLFDVFHHLIAPEAFVREARRALNIQGRLIIFEPYISLASAVVYGLFHHEPVARRKPIDLRPVAPRPRQYYAAQGNATRLFFGAGQGPWPEGWRIIHAAAFASFSYLCSGGYSKPALYPVGFLPWLERLDARLSRWPRLFGARCLVALAPQAG